MLSFLLVVFGSGRQALGARIPAPMCTPDAQSMAAPLQRTPTSAAEFKREPVCPSVSGRAWEILPAEPSLPLDWYQSGAEPLWISQTVIKAARAAFVSLVVPVELENAERTGFSTGVFRPPKFGVLTIDQC
jgi:hypothetical protein